MTIHKLMNTSPVTANVQISVFSRYGNRLIFFGKYEDSIPYVYNLEVDSWEIINTTRKYDRLKITFMKIYADAE